MFGAAMGAFSSAMFKEDRKKGGLDTGVEATQKPASNTATFMNAFETSMQAQAQTGELTGMYTQNSVTTAKEGLLQGFKPAAVDDIALLDKIAKHEGTYKSGYDTEYSYGKYGGERNQLSDMTIAEVMAHQKKMVANQEGKQLKSSAIGRYQMLRKTLAEEARVAGLDISTTKFTPEVQDSLILQRLDRVRGLGKYKAGKLSENSFVKNLSKEFASINNPETGRSYYGQGAKDWQ